MVLSRPIIALALVLSLLVGPSTAMAQEIDPIGALLDQVPAPAPPQQMPQTWRPAPVTSSPRPLAVTSGTPTRIEDTGKTPDGPLTATDLGYEGRLRSAFQSAQGSQGPLEGRWVVRTGDVALYVLQLADRGGLEGAWRDPRRPGASGASGFINNVTRSGESLTVSFTAVRGDVPVSLSLRLQPDGQISGGLVERGVQSTVTMSRQ